MSAASSSEPDEPDEQISAPEDDEVYWQRYYRLRDDGHGFPADVALTLAVVKSLDTVYALRILKRCADPELAARILL